MQIASRRRGVVQWLYYVVKLPQLWEIFLFIRVMNEPMMAIRDKAFQSCLKTNYINRVVLVFKVVF